MRVVAGFAALFVMGGVSAAAQYTLPPVPQGGTVVCTEKALPDDGRHAKGSTVRTCTVAPVSGCPIDMRVRQRMGGDMVAVDKNGVKRHVFAQRLRLFLKDVQNGEGDRKMVSATVTVHGSGGKARLAPVSGNPAGDRASGSFEKTLTVGLADWGEPGVSGDFGLRGFASASRVDLDSVTYSDGTVWKLAGNETCHVAPDPMMLINQ